MSNSEEEVKCTKKPIELVDELRVFIGRTWEALDRFYFNVNANKPRLASVKTIGSWIAEQSNADELLHAIWDAIDSKIYPGLRDDTQNLAEYHPFVIWFHGLTKGVPIAWPLGELYGEDDCDDESVHERRQEVSNSLDRKELKLKDVLVLVLDQFTIPDRSVDPNAVLEGCLEQLKCDMARAKEAVDDHRECEEGNCGTGGGGRDDDDDDEDNDDGGDCTCYEDMMTHLRNVTGAVRRLFVELCKQEFFTIGEDVCVRAGLEPYQFHDATPYCKSGALLRVVRTQDEEKLELARRAEKQRAMEEKQRKWRIKDLEDRTTRAANDLKWGQQELESLKRAAPNAPNAPAKKKVSPNKK